MDKFRNPYRPGAGLKPLILAGRDSVIERGEILIKSVKNGAPQRPIMIYGLRGVGKTVLLHEFQTMAEQEGYLVEMLEMSENEDFKKEISDSLRTILLKIDRIENAKSFLKKAFGVFKSFKMSLPDGGPEFSIDIESVLGYGDSGNFERDLKDLMISVGEAARESGKFICFLIDETQYLDEKSLSALIAANHRISQLELPIIFICAGLPQIAALAGNAKSYSERLFDYIRINGLPLEDAKKAITGPANQQGISFTDEAIDELVKLTGCYPYFIQVYCKCVWEKADLNPISKDAVDMAKVDAIKILDESFFKARLDRATELEKRLIRLMGEMGDGPYKVADILEKANKPHNWLSPIRANLIKKGFLYDPTFGMLDFTVPKFGEFVRRHFEIV